MDTIAFLGLGRMGQAMADRLLACGYKLIVWNRSPEKAAALTGKGAVLAKTPAEAAAEARIVFSMVADDQASAACWSGPDGALAAMDKGSFVIECSTLSSDHVAQLALAAKEKGLIYIDCPVTGLPEAAAAGKLTLLTGADTVALEKVRPVLASLSTAIKHFGPIGSGTAYKLMINLMGAVQIAALAEGLALAEKLGLDPETVVSAIETGAAASPNVIRYARKMAARDFSDAPDFTLSLRHKDALYGARLARNAGCIFPLGESAVAWFAPGAAETPDRDEAALILSVTGIPGRKK